MDMERWQHVFLILFMLPLLVRAPTVIGQATPQLDLTLIGQGQGQYVAPAGQITKLKIEILNVGPSDIYLSEGDAYLDPSLNGTWELAHSEGMGNFQLNYLQSAIWTFELAIPAKIQAANETNGIPQVALLVKITYLTARNVRLWEQGEFSLDVPGASVQQTNDFQWLVAASVVGVAAVVAVAYKLTLKKR